MATAVRWGILGAGGIANTFGRDLVLEPGHVVAAVGARDLDRAAALAEQLGAPRSYGSYDELVADPDIDVIYIATTHAQHRDHALLALRAGKPVLVEKAFTLNAVEAAEVVAEARARRLFCMEAMWLRMSPLIVAAREIVQSGEIGEVRNVRAELSRLFPYDPGHRLFRLDVGGGALLDLGVYPVTLAWLFLGQPDGVQATGELSPTGSDLTAAMQWVYADGRFAQVACTAALRSELPTVIAGTAGWLQLDGAVHHADRLIVHSEHDRVIDAPPYAGHGYGGEIREVARCLEAGRTESPLAPLDETVAILRLLDEVRAQVGVRYPSEVTG